METDYEITPNDVVKMWTTTKMDWMVLLVVVFLSIWGGGWIGYHTTRTPTINQSWPICQVCHKRLPRFGSHTHL